VRRQDSRLTGVVALVMATFCAGCVSLPAEVARELSAPNGARPDNYALRPPVELARVPPLPASGQAP